MLASPWQLKPSNFQKYQVSRIKFWFPGHEEVSGIEIEILDPVDVPFRPRKIGLSATWFNWLIRIECESPRVIRPIYFQHERSMLSFYPSPDTIMKWICQDIAGGHDTNAFGCLMSQTLSEEVSLETCRRYAR